MLRFSSSPEVHFWLIKLTDYFERTSEFYNIISSKEKQRAEAFSRGVDRNKFIVRRGILRELISKYTGKDGFEIKYRYGAYGKPILNCAGYSNLSFNCSQSNGIAFYAFTLNQTIGIDIEYIDQQFSVIQIAKLFFSNFEYESLMSLPDEEKHEAFFKCWTRKEAYVKATGDGLSFPLNKFVIAMSEQSKSALLFDWKYGESNKKWQFFTFKPKDGFIASVALSLPETRIKVFDYDDN